MHPPQTNGTFSRVTILAGLKEHVDELDVEEVPAGVNTEEATRAAVPEGIRHALDKAFESAIFLFCFYEVLTFEYLFIPARHKPGNSLALCRASACARGCLFYLNHVIT